MRSGGSWRQSCAALAWADAGEAKTNTTANAARISSEEGQVKRLPPPPSASRQARARRSLPWALGCNFILPVLVALPDPRTTLSSRLYGARLREMLVQQSATARDGPTNHPRPTKVGSVRLFEARRLDSRSWTSASGRLVGGKPFSRAALYLIFAEPYLSRIRIAGNKGASSRSLTSAAG